MSHPIERVERRVVYENRFVRVHDDVVRFPSGDTGTYVRIDVLPDDGQGAVLIVRHENRFALVRTYRYPLGTHQWAFPRGFAHGPDLTETVRNELREELGCALRSMAVIGSVTPDSGLLSSRVSVVLVEVDGSASAPDDLEEVSAVDWVDLERLQDLIRSGDIEDGFTLSAWALLTIREQDIPGAQTAVRPPRA